MEQNSPEWLAWRQKGIGSSDIGTIIGVNPYKMRSELLDEKKGLVQPPDLSNNFHVKRGQDLEPYARDMVNKELEAEFAPAIFTHEEYPFIKYSSDGVDFKRNELLEVKCMAARNHNKVLETMMPIDYYMPQLGWAMLVTKIPLIHFVAYNPKHPRPYLRLEIKEDKEYQNFLLQEALKFWDEVTGC